MLKINKYTFGMGDRFAHEGCAQLQAILSAREAGIDVYPVWNKSNREHTIVGSKPDDLRAEADEAVNVLGWQGDYYVDADHIGMKTVDNFIKASNFYTLDVADFTGKPADENAIEDFVKAMEQYSSRVLIPDIAQPFALGADSVRAAARKFLLATQEAARIYRHIEVKKGRDNFVTEVSVDETDTAQTPVELFLILAMLAREGIPAQTIAPKFTGRFNKGVDYEGNILQFEKEFDENLSVISFVVREFGLPKTLKLSIHSGSDKFSLYPIINRLIKMHDAGLHIKTAGTTWLEEVIGLAEAGGEGLEIAKEIYAGGYPLAADLIAPYAPVVDIDLAKLPKPEEVTKWTSETFVSMLRHDQSHASYNAQFRQFIHVAFKIAAKLGGRYTGALKQYRETIAYNVNSNLLDRHIIPIFQ
jgi:hypothetical protein